MALRDSWDQTEILSAAERADLVSQLLEGFDAAALGGLLERLETRHGARARAPAPSAAQLEALRPKVVDEPELPRRFDVVLRDPGASKIRVIKELRALTGLGLRQAKARVDAAPGAVVSDLAFEEAERIAAILEDSGASVELSPYEK